jgi:sialate O-acetylesterase
VQLPRYKDSFVGVREAQFLAQRSISNSAMVVSIDTGKENLLHPGDKLLIGERAAKAALGLRYKLPDEYTGPMFAEAMTRDNSIIARFTHAGSGLEARGNLDGFILSGESGEFAPAKSVC